MQLRGKLAEADLDEWQRMVRSKMYWPKFILINWYGIGLICVALAATITGFLGYTKPNWQALGVIWLVITLIIGWAVSSTKRQTARNLKL
jgi:membrane protein DedA with SNARE-associated domain